MRPRPSPVRDMQSQRGRNSTKHALRRGGSAFAQDLHDDDATSLACAIEQREETLEVGAIADVTIEANPTYR